LNKKETKKTEQKLEICASLQSRDQKVLSLSLENESKKSLDLNLEIDDKQVLKIDFDWSPDYWQSIRETSSGYSQQLIEELIREVAQKSAVVSQQLTDDLALPLVSLFSDEFQDLFQELLKNFSIPQPIVEIWYQMTSSADRLVQRVSQVLPSFDQTLRSARKQCKRSEVCYKTLYALENYGLDSLWDLLLSNAQQLAKQTHRLVMTTSGRIYGSMPSIPDWITSSVEDYRQSIEALIQSIIDSNTEWKRLSQQFSRVLNEIQKNSEEIDWNSIKESIEELFQILFSSQNSSRVVVWDPKRGRAQIEIRSPVTRRMRSLADQKIKSMFF
jgi:hypothetical protein